MQFYIKKIFTVCIRKYKNLLIIQNFCTIIKLQIKVLENFNYYENEKVFKFYFFCGGNFF